MGRQHSVPAVLVDPNKTMTTVYSSANPPRGLSGVLRRLAYRIPTYRARRWMLLLLADRIDVLEHGGRRPIAKLAGGPAMFALSYLAVRALRNA